MKNDPPNLAAGFGQLAAHASPFSVGPELRSMPPRRMASELNRLDWPLVVTLRRRASERIAAVSERWQAEHGMAMPDEDRRLRARSLIRQVVREYATNLSNRGEALWSATEEQRYAEAVDSAIFGFGRLQPLFEIPDAENIEITGHDCVLVQLSDGRRVVHEPVADSDEELIEAIRFLGETANPPRPFDDAHPTMTLALGSRFRLHAIGYGLSYRPSIVIRQHQHPDVTVQQLSATGMFPRELAELLTAAVRARKSVVISGDQGAGKTTLLRALIAAIPRGERIGTLETDYELLTHLSRRNVLALQARLGLGESADGKSVGAYSVADLIPEALRQNLSRLIIGEVRGCEAGAMFEAMQAGAGTMSTTHSNSASSTIDRLASRVAQGRVLTVEEAMRQIAHHISLIVHVTLVDDTWRGGIRTRFISEVIQLTGAVEANRPITHLIYQADEKGQPELFCPSAELTRELAPFRSRR